MKNKEENKKVSKSELLTCYNNMNQRLDILRNGIFNIIVSMKYITRKEFDITDVDIHNFNNSLKLLEKKFSDFVTKMDIKFKDVIKDE